MTMISYDKRRDDFIPTKDAWSKTATHYRKQAHSRRTLSIDTVVVAALREITP